MKLKRKQIAAWQQQRIHENKKKFAASVLPFVDADFFGRI
jgi:hypothetical protein